MENLLYYWQKNKLKITLYCSVALTILVASLSFFLINSKYEKNNETIEPINILSKVEEKEKENIKLDETIKIDIKGQIKTPGVYELPKDSRIIDAIEYAGGLLENAYTECINLSKILEDEEIIMIYNWKELNNNTLNTLNKTCTIQNTSNGNIENKNESLNTLVNINTASKEELMTLNGIGESKALNIIEYRTNNKFKNKEDLKKVSGIGETIYEKIKDNITV